MTEHAEQLAQTIGLGVGREGMRKGRVCTAGAPAPTSEKGLAVAPRGETEFSIGVKNGKRSATVPGVSCFTAVGVAALTERVDDFFDFFAAVPLADDLGSRFDLAAAFEAPLPLDAGGFDEPKLTVGAGGVGRESATASVGGLTSVGADAAGVVAAPETDGGALNAGVAGAEATSGVAMSPSKLEPSSSMLSRTSLLISGSNVPCNMSSSLVVMSFARWPLPSVAK